MSLELVSVALPVPLRQLFDYLVPAGWADRLQPGVRVEVHFGRRRCVGLVATPPRRAEGEGHAYKLVERVLDDGALAPAEWVRLLQRAAG